MLPYVYISGFPVPMYLLCWAIGLPLAGGFAIVRQRGGRFRVPADDFLHTVLLSFLGGIGGAKLLQTLVMLLQHAQDPAFWSLKTWISIAFGGGVFYGGLLGALAAAWVYARAYKVDFGNVTDLLLPPLLLFHVFARLGCFFAGCCYGSEAPWGIAFSHAKVAPNGVPLIPVQMIEAALVFLLLLALLLLRPERKRPGVILPLYLAAYGFARFFLEFLRGDMGRGVWLLSTSQWISLIVVLPAAVLMLARLRRAAQRRAGREKNACIAPGNPL